MILASLLLTAAPGNIELPIRGSEIVSIRYVPVEISTFSAMNETFSEIGGKFSVRDHLPLFSTPEREAFADTLKRVREPDERVGPDRLERYSSALIRLRVDLTGRRAWLMDQSGSVRFLTGDSSHDYILTAPRYNTLTNRLEFKRRASGIKITDLGEVGVGL